MKTSKYNTAYKYALYGAVFGCLFPLTASSIDAYNTYHLLNFQNVMAVQSSNPLLWIIDTAPIFLGLFSFFIGFQISKIRYKNKQLIKTQSQLILQEQMASIGKMTAGIAHEIKNPLNFISNFSEGSIEVVEELKLELVAQKHKFSSDEFENLMELVNDLRLNAIDVRNNSDRVNRIVYTLLDKTRGTKGHEKLVDIHVLLDENIYLAFHSYRANYPAFNLHIEKEYDKEVPSISLNAQSLGRVILNILNNACYALNRKQESAGKDFKPTIVIRTRKVADFLEISLFDNGDGIPLAIQEKIFEPFFTTKPIGEGNTGLGLSISKDIIMKEYSGSIDIDSVEGKYTNFVIMIPVSEQVIAPRTNQILESI